MLQFGAIPKQTREINLDDIFFLRLKLLMVMAADCLAGVRLSPLRRQVMRRNAQHVKIESAILGGLEKGGGSGIGARSSVFIDDYFYRCAHDIAVMVDRIARLERVDHELESVLERKIEAINLIRATASFEKRFSLCAAVAPEINEGPSAAVWAGGDPMEGFETASFRRETKGVLF